MRRQWDLLSLVAGLVFVVAGVAQMLGFNLANPTLWRAWPALFVLAGVAALVNRSRTSDD